MSADANLKPPGKLRRWLLGGGGFLAVSIAVHALLLIGAAVWVVQTVQAKRKLNFSAAPPNSGEGSRQLEHRVQTAKRTATMTPPPASTRIVSSANNVKVALPEVALPSTASLAIPGRMGGMAGSPSAFKPASAASGAPNGGGAIAAMPAGVTAFGFKVPANAPVTGLRGVLYYMRRKPDGTPYPENPDRADYLSRVEKLFGNNGKLNEREAQNYLRFGQQLVTQTILFSSMPGETAPKAFGVDQVPGTQQSWVAVYRARIFAESPKRYRFVGGGNEVLIVRVNDKVVLDGCYQGVSWSNGKKNPTGHRSAGDLSALWSDVRVKGDPFVVPATGVDLEVIIGEGWGGAFGADLCIEEDGKTYPDDVRPIFKIEGYQKLLPQLNEIVGSLEGRRALTLEGPTFKVTR
jgi:hypothetical protein